MHYRRIIALLLTLLVGLALSLPDRGDGSVGTLRRGKHVSRNFAQALVVRSERQDRHDRVSHRRGGARAWATRLSEPPASSLSAAGGHAARSVDLLPSHWGARHLVI